MEGKRCYGCMNIKTSGPVCQHCGYNDSSFFIKQFRKYKGITPRRYRAGE